MVSILIFSAFALAFGCRNKYAKLELQMQHGWNNREIGNQVPVTASAHSARHYTQSRIVLNPALRACMVAECCKLSLTEPMLSAFIRGSILVGLNTIRRVPNCLMHCHIQTIRLTIAGYATLG